MKDFMAMKKSLQSYPWDLIIETQGLIKSALIANLAKPKQSTVAQSSPTKRPIIYGIGNQTQYSGMSRLPNLFTMCRSKFLFSFMQWTDPALSGCMWS
jgi:heptosyltransferase-1